MNSFSTPARACLVLAAICFALADLKASEGVLSRTASVPQYFGDFFSLISNQSKAPGFWPCWPITEAHILAGLALLSLFSTFGCVVFALLARRRREPSTAYAGTLVLALAVGVLSFRLLAWVCPLHFVVAT